MPNSYETLLTKQSLNNEPVKEDNPCICLIVPPSPQIPTHGREFLLTAPFEGISSLATVLKNAGCKVKIIDYRQAQDSLKEALENTLKYADILGIATFADSFIFLEKFTKRVKETNPDLPIILGGSLVTSAPTLIMKKVQADIAVLGEGELTILELMEALSTDKKDSISNISGICYKKDGEIKFTGKRTQIANLDILPILDLTLWPSVEKDSHIEKLGFSASRGCKMSCSFCFKTIPHLSYKSSERVKKELFDLKEKYGISYIYINDLTFVSDPQKTKSYCKVLKASGIRWACSTRVKSIDEKLLQLMKETGCEEIWYGIESVDQNVLDINNKGIAVEDIENAVKKTNRVGIKVMGNFIIGLLGETEESLDKMIRFIETKDVIPCSIKFLTPFPGTRVYQYAKEKGLIKDDLEYLKSLCKRRVNDENDEIVNCTTLPEKKLRDAFRKIRQISYERYGPLNWS